MSPVARSARWFTVASLALALLGATVMPAQAQEQAPSLTAVIEPAPEEKTDSTLVQYYKVKVFKAGTTELDPTVYEVYISPQDEAGRQQEIFSMLRRRATYHNEPEGIYGGLVYFPQGGKYTLNAVVNKYVSDIDKIEDKSLRKAPPVTYARTTLEVQVEGKALESVGREAFFGKDVRSRPTWTAIPIGMLWIHSLAAMGWGVLVALMVLLALPAGRRFLSNRGVNFFDQRLGVMVRAYWWVTTVVVGTGVYNLLNNVPYETPFSPSKAEQIFRLPYGQPYFVSLFIKLAMYAVMLGMAVPVVREAKRRADLLGGSAYQPTPAGVPVNAEIDPWGTGGGAPRQGHRRFGLPVKEPALAAAEVAAGGVATLAPPAPAAAAEVSAGQATAEEEPSRPTIKAAVGVLAVGVPVLFGAVTVMKDLHKVIETIRYWTYWISG